MTSVFICVYGRAAAECLQPDACIVPGLLQGSWCHLQHTGWQWVKAKPLVLVTHAQPRLVGGPHAHALPTHVHDALPLAQSVAPKQVTWAHAHHHSLILLIR